MEADHNPHHHLSSLPAPRTHRPHKKPSSLSSYPRASPLVSTLSPSPLPLVPFPCKSRPRPSFHHPGRPHLTRHESSPPSTATRPGHLHAKPRRIPALNIATMCTFTKNYHIYTSCLDPGAHYFGTSVDGNRKHKCSRGPHERYIVEPGACPLCYGGSYS